MTQESTLIDPYWFSTLQTQGRGPSRRVFFIIISSFFST